ncbi:MAG: PPC domain-containing protein, partial [Planctomycetaceae bacterium]
MKTVLQICQSLQSLCSGPRHRRRARRLSQSGDGLESRQLMTALIGGFYEREGNNSAAQANDLEVAQSDLLNSVYSRAEGQIGGTDTQDFFRLQLDQPVSNARVSLYNLTADLDVQLRNESGRILASGTRSNFASELLTMPTLSAGTYYIRVYRGVVSARSSYSLSFQSTPSNIPVNPPTPPSLTGDVEPNNSRLMAGSVGSLTSGVTRTVSGSVTSGDREDWYRVPVGANGSLQIDLTGMTADLDVEVQDSSGNVVGSSTNSSSTSEQIRLNGLSSGDYFVRIYRFSTAGSGYRLSTLVRTGTPVTPPAPTPPPVIVG